MALFEKKASEIMIKDTIVDGFANAPHRSLYHALGLTKEDDPTKIEYELMKILPKSQWILYNFQTIAHGRRICIARRPACEECCLADVCKGKKVIANG